MQVPCLTDYGRNRGFRAQQQLQVAVLGRAHVGAAGRAEGRDFRMTKARLADLAKEGGVAFVGTWPAALDVIKAEIVETPRDFDLVGGRQGDILGLAAVAQGRVIDLNVL